MPHRGWALPMVVVVWSSLSMGAISAAAEDPPSTCHAIADDAARLACYDRVTHRPAHSAPPPSSLSQPQLQPQLQPQSESQPSGERASAPVIEPQHPAEAPAPSSRGIRQRTESADAVVGAQVVEIITTSIGRHRFQLDNGEIWEQVEPGRTTLRAGDTVDVRPSALGAWQLRESGGTSRSMKVRRVQ